MNRKAFFKVLGASVLALISHKLPSSLIKQQPAPIDDIVIDWHDSIRDASRQIGEDTMRLFLAGLHCPVTIEFVGLDCFIKNDSEGAGEI